MLGILGFRVWKNRLRASNSLGGEALAAVTLSTSNCHIVMKVSYESNIVSSTQDLAAKLEKLEKMDESYTHTPPDRAHLFER